MLQVEHISKRYGTTLALDNVALTIPKESAMDLLDRTDPANLP